VGKLLMKTLDENGDRLIYSAGHAMLRSGFAFNIGYGLPEAAAFTRSREVFGAPGAAALYKASLIHAVSDKGEFFDPSMFLYAEDTDVDWRSRRQGWRCWYAAGAVAYHRGSCPSGRLKMMAIGNRYVSVLKNATTKNLLVFNLPFMAAHCLMRLIVTPVFGTRLIAHIARRAPAAVRRRHPTAAMTSQLRDWFRWSTQQPSKQRSSVRRLRGMIPLLNKFDHRHLDSPVGG
jgi:GT2 family glycosyltransferase